MGADLNTVLYKILRYAKFWSSVELTGNQTNGSEFKSNTGFGAVSN